MTLGANTTGTIPQLTSNGGDQADSEEWTFRWQDKAFSQHEEELYSDLGNCSTVLEQKYHRDILALRNAGGRPNRRLFSYVDIDPPPCMAEIHQQVTNWNTGPETYADQYGSSVRRRRGRTKGVATRAFAAQDPVLQRPSEEQRINARLIGVPTQVMYIMADLRRMDGQDSVDEHQLCEVKIDDNGMVIISPDFNLDKPPYRVENSHREIFEYRLFHTSEAISAEEEAKEAELLSELYVRHTESLVNKVGACFAHPPEGEALRVLMFGEIVSAEGFEYDDLYIRTHLELPEFWQCSDEKPLDIVTQISRTRSSHLHNTAHFNCPMECELLYNNPILKDDELPKWPRILIQVASFDYWERHRVEGYGYLDLPNTPGQYQFTVNTWRPSGSLRDKMARFFVGGSAEIADISYIAKPRDFEGVHLSKYGFCTQSSGSVAITLYIAHQSSLIIRQQQMNEATSSAKHKGFKTSVLATLDVYQRAKKSAAAAMRGDTLK